MRTDSARSGTTGGGPAEFGRARRPPAPIWSSWPDGAGRHGARAMPMHGPAYRCPPHRSRSPAPSNRYETPTPAICFAYPANPRRAGCRAHRPVRRVPAHPDRALRPLPPTARRRSADGAPTIPLDRHRGSRAMPGARRSWTPRRSPDRCAPPRRRAGRSRIPSAGAAAETTNTTATGASPGRRSSASTNSVSGSRSRSAAATLVEPASQGPVTSTASRRRTAGGRTRTPSPATNSSAASTPAVIARPRQAGATIPARCRRRRRGAVRSPARRGSGASARPDEDVPPPRPSVSTAIPAPLSTSTAAAIRAPAVRSEFRNASTSASRLAIASNSVIAASIRP